MMSIKLYDASEIEKINSLIHDCWFDLNDLQYDKSISMFQIKFKRLAFDKAQIIKNLLIAKQLQVPVLESYLKIFNVENYKVQTYMENTIYDFNKLIYLPNDGVIKILTEIPIEIWIKIKNFEIVIEETNNIIEWKKIWSLIQIWDF